jgi:membrane protease YdiL (CAAX protease family)
MFVFSGKDAVPVLPIMVVSLIVFFIANRVIRFGTLGLQRRNLAKLPLLLVYASLLIAIPEEILFRGILQTYLYSFVPYAFLAVLLSSLVFGFAHCLNDAKGFGLDSWNWKLIGMTFLAGLFLGFSFYSTSSLVVPVIVHVLYILIMKLCIKDRE